MTDGTLGVLLSLLHCDHKAYRAESQMWPLHAGPENR
jgi:hypothetical protein